MPSTLTLRDVDANLLDSRIPDKLLRLSIHLNHILLSATRFPAFPPVAPPEYPTSNHPPRSIPRPAHPSVSGIPKRGPVQAWPLAHHSGLRLPSGDSAS